MKTAIYIEDGVTQIVLTPETEWEKKIISSADLGEKVARIMRGGFFANQAGYFRHDETPDGLIFRIEPNRMCAEIQAAGATVKVIPWDNGPVGLGDVLRDAAVRADAVAANPGMLMPREHIQ